MKTVNNKNNIPLVKPFMPPITELIPFLERIHESQILTNNGPIHDEFEEALGSYLGVKYISLFSSGTLALTIALKALNLKGDVITTPFTSPATVQAIYWNNLKPVFADIKSNDLNIDPARIESAISPKTCAILPVHIFGSPCEVEEISRISESYRIPVIYDAAHCFGVEINGNSIFNFGELSVISFHATKVFNTLEGGAVICCDERMKRTIDTLKNTGIGKNNLLEGYGLNAKLNEFQAAYGFCHLRYMNEILREREKAAHEYWQVLKEIPGLRLPEPKTGIKHNFSYMPVLINAKEYGTNRDVLAHYLAQKNIITKKYFFPLVSDYKEFNSYKSVEMPVAEWVSNNILCLPMFFGISNDQIYSVASSIQELHFTLKHERKIELQS